MANESHVSQHTSLNNMNHVRLRGVVGEIVFTSLARSKSDSFHEFSGGLVISGREYLRDIVSRMTVMM